MDAAELSRWTRFAAKGGIGKCTAVQDCIAESNEDLMFLKDDEITVLMQIVDAEGVFLGYCEGVVGRFQSKDVRFHSKLKRPVMTKRVSSMLAAKSPTPSSTPSMPSTPVTPTPVTSNFAHTHAPSIAHSVQSVESSYSTQSGTTASSAHMDFGLPRVLSPPSIYDQLPNVSSFAQVVTVDNENVAPRAKRKSSYISTLSRRSSVSAPSTYAGDETDREETERNSVVSTASRLSRASITSDGEVGIGLSLLASLGGESTDDDDSDSDAEGNTTFVQPALPQQVLIHSTPSPSPSLGSTASSSSASSTPLAAFPRPPSGHVLLGVTDVPTSRDPESPFGTFGRAVEAAAESAAGAGRGMRALVQGIFGGSSTATLSPAPPTQATASTSPPTLTPAPTSTSAVHKSTESTATTSESDESSGSSETEEGGGPSTAHGHEQTSSQVNLDGNVRGDAETEAEKEVGGPEDIHTDSDTAASSPPPVSPTSLKSFKSTFRFPMRTEGVNGYDDYPGGLGLGTSSGAHYSDRPTSSSSVYQSPPPHQDAMHESTSSLSIPAVPGPGIPTSQNHNPTALSTSSSVSTTPSLSLPSSNSGPSFPSNTTSSPSTPFSSSFSISSGPPGGSGDGEYWEGASDIYDNYFYRYSVMSRMSGMSGGSAGSADRRELAKEWERVNGFGYGEDKDKDKGVEGEQEREKDTEKEREREREREENTEVKEQEANGGLGSASTVVPTPTSTPQQQRPPRRSDSLTMQRAAQHIHLDSMSSMASVLEGRLGHGADGEDHDEDEVDELFNKLEQLSAKPTMGFLAAHARLLENDRNREGAAGGDGDLDNSDLVKEGEGDERATGTTKALNVVKNSPVSPRFKKSDIVGYGSGQEQDAQLGKHDSLGSGAGPSKGAGSSTARRPAPLNFGSGNGHVEAGRNHNSLSANGPGPSPLLHTRWGSPVSSAGGGSVYDDGSGGYPTPHFSAGGNGNGEYGRGLGRFSRPDQDANKSEFDSDNEESEVGIDVIDEDGSENGEGRIGIAAGIAGALREGMQEEKEKGQNQNAGVDGDGEEDMSLDTMTLGHGGGIVIEDDEELPSHAVDPNESELVNMSLTTVDSESGVNNSFTGSKSSDYDSDGDSDISHSRSSKISRNSRMELAPLVITNNVTAPTGSALQVPSPTSPTSHATSPYSVVSPYSPGDLPLDLLPPPSPSTFPPALSSQQLSPPIPKPSLAELRGYEGDATPSGNNSGPVLRPGATGQADYGQRRSLFLPHPNAPKAPVEGPGPMYIRSVASADNQNNAPQQSSQQQPQQQGRGPDPKKVAANVIRMALAAPPPPAIPPQNMLPPPSSMPIRGVGNKRNPPPPPPAPFPRGPTIYARVDVDLGSATGPVPITFSIEPMGPPPLPIPQNVNLQQQDSGLQNPWSVTPPVVERTQSPNAAGGMGSGGVRRSVTAPAHSQNSSTETMVQGGNAGDGKPTSTPNGSGGGSGVIPRANFFPQAGTARPRSRSFSGFNSSSPPVSIPGMPGDKNQPALRTRGSLTSLSSSPLRPDTSPVKSPPKPGPSPLRPSSLDKMPSLSKLRGPSPLSLPQNNIKLPSSGLVGGGIKPPKSPLAVSSSGPPSPIGNGRPSQLRKVTSATSLRGSTSSLAGRSSISRTIGDVGSSDVPPLSPVLASKPSMDGSHTHSRRSTSEHLESDRASTVSSRSQAAASPPPPPVGRQSSINLRSKLSLPNMRRSNPSRQGSASSSLIPTENETMQVEDMDFELIKPNFAQFGANGRSSEDSGIFPPPSSRGSQLPDSRPDISSLHLRAESPAISISSGTSGTSRGANTGGFASDLSTSAAYRSKVSSKSSDAEANMDAHRQREQKWMALMSSVPASQAKKNKKVRKLVGEGIPSSVRYLAWSHLTDSKSKNVAGVYAQLVKRARVAAFAEVERDVNRCFGENPQSQATLGPLSNLLQAYLTMVPDVQYSTGLTLIAGHLLLSAPEDDAFWIFVSMMDSVLRPYFSPNSTQMEVDAALFSRALEANDAQVSKKVLVDMSINPAHICFPWFTSLFVSSLPADYINRAWDLYLYEGVPFLIRIGLAIVYCCRRAILEATSEEAVLQYLKHPSANWLPPSPEAFITLSFSFKVKDDDVRKQRVKMEAQVKRQAQAPRLASSASAISLPRS